MSSLDVDSEQSFMVANEVEGRRLKTGMKHHILYGSLSSRSMLSMIEFC